MASQGATTIFIGGLAVLVPTFRSTEHLNLGQAEIIVAAPTLGLLLTLVLWGAAADRFGERWVMAIGLGLAGTIQFGQLAVHGLFGRSVIYVVAGAAGASVNAASGRVVLGWFSEHERGLAMGARQMSQPLGLSFAGILLPSIAQRYGIDTALMVPALACLAVGVLVAFFVADPSRAAQHLGEKLPSPYGEPTLWRIHLASALMVLPQLGLSSLAAEYLHAAHHWSVVGAGDLFASVQFVGAFVRLAAGRWSDRVRSRLRPMRQLAIANLCVVLAFALCQATYAPLTPYALVAALLITVSANGLAFTAVAEIAGTSWAGRALGIHNTGQSVTGALAPPVAGDLVDAAGYATTFAVMAGFSALAAFIIPVADEQRRRSAAHLPAAAEELASS